MASDAVLPILIAAYGNDMAADDAFGPLVAEALRATTPANVEIVSLGMKPAGLLDILANRRALCVVDAAHCDGLTPGTLLEIDDPLSLWERVRVRADSEQDNTCSTSALTPSPSPKERGELRLVHDCVLSTHGLSVADEIRLAKQLDLCPSEVRLVAVVAESVEVGRPISEAVSRQISVAAAQIIRWAEHIPMPSIQADGLG
jgi:Ni,Fe-hydrogenase maturation factor